MRAPASIGLYPNPRAVRKGDDLVFAHGPMAGDGSRWTVCLLFDRHSGRSGFGAALSAEMHAGVERAGIVVDCDMPLSPTREKVVELETGTLFHNDCSFYVEIAWQSKPGCASVGLARQKCLPRGQWLRQIHRSQAFMAAPLPRMSMDKQASVLQTQCRHSVRIPRCMRHWQLATIV